jgi:hypothetical protein
MPEGATTCSPSMPDVAYSIVWAPDSGIASVHTLYRGATCIYRSSVPENLLHALQIDLTWSIASRSSGFTFIHAGAVTYRDQGIVLPGVSGAGKSTLVSHLLARGCAYYSDEYAVMDHAGVLHPFPCLIKLKDQPLNHQRVHPDELGGRLDHGKVHVVLVGFPRHARGVGLYVEELSRSSGALRLLEHMPRARLRPKEALTCAAATTDKAACLSLQYEDGARAADHLITRLSANDAMSQNIREKGVPCYV